MLTVQEQLDALTAAVLAHRAALQEVAVSLYADAKERRAARDRACEPFDVAFANPKMTQRGHALLQKAVAEIEQVFQDSPSPPLSDGLYDH